MRIVIADDSVLLREGLTRLLDEAGIETVAAVGDGDALVAAVAEHTPDLALIDIRMPPTFTHEGARAATLLRETAPELGILLLSQTIENHYALELVKRHPTHFGYLLKDRVLDVETLTDTIAHVAAGGTVLDPEIVSHFLTRHSAQQPLATLTPREREVLTMMAEGRSNRAIARTLVINDKTLESHVSSIFTKLGLIPEPDDHRRVLAVLAWLDQQRAGDAGR
jgi:DNA-binding NarL/FixJ family response regulator